MTSLRQVTGCTLPGGFHNIFPYHRHSDVRTLLFATTLTGTYASIFDMAKFLAGRPRPGTRRAGAGTRSHGAVSRLLRRI